MKTILVLSPHLDDAAFSAGPLLAEISGRAKVIVATAFTKSVLPAVGFALACQLDKGLSADVDYMACRRGEDIAWSSLIGATAVHGDFAEAPHRGYQSAKELFCSVLATDRAEEELVSWLSTLAEDFKPELVLCPIGIGHHVDHVLLRQAARKQIASKFPLFFYKDLPYAATLRQIDLEEYFGDTNNLQQLKASFTGASLARAQLATEAYKTQIPFQFGGVDDMKRKLAAAWSPAISFFHFQEDETVLIDMLKN